VIVAEARPVVKPEFLRELCQVDTGELTALVQRTSETFWNLEDSRKENRFSVFHDTRHIVFRFIDGNRDHRVFYSNPIWEIWRRFLLPVMDAAAHPYGFRSPVFPKVMLARLSGGSVVDRHTDGAGSNLYTPRFTSRFRPTTRRGLQFETAGFTWNRASLTSSTILRRTARRIVGRRTEST
jgi:hypothetical protein